MLKYPLIFFTFAILLSMFYPVIGEPQTETIKLKAGDTTDGKLGFYFAVDVSPEMIANQLVIDAPATANAGEAVSIKVTAGGTAVDNAAVTIGYIEAGLTGSDGILSYTLPRTLKGTYNITATKLGYEKAIKTIEVLNNKLEMECYERISTFTDRESSEEQPSEERCSSKASDIITITVTSGNGNPIEGAEVNFNNTVIGTTNSSGKLDYMSTTSGLYNITATKFGYEKAARVIQVFDAPTITPNPELTINETLNPELL